MTNHGGSFVKVCLLSNSVLMCRSSLAVGDNIGVMVSITGNSTSSNQLEAGSIIVRDIKSIWDPSLPLRVYKPIRSTHNTSQGVMTTVLVGNFPYFRVCHLFIWQDWHLLTYDQIVVRILF